MLKKVKQFSKALLAEMRNECDPNKIPRNGSRICRGNKNGGPVCDCRMKKGLANGEMQIVDGNYVETIDWGPVDDFNYKP